MLETHHHLLEGATLPTLPYHHHLACDKGIGGARSIIWKTGREI